MKPCNQGVWWGLAGSALKLEATNRIADVLKQGKRGVTGDRSRDSGEENGLKPQWSNRTLFHVVLATMLCTPEKSSYRNSDVCMMT